MEYDRDADRGAKHGITASLESDTVTDGFGRVDTILNIEAVRGSAFADVITGDGFNNDLQGEGGNDTINGRLGDDFIDGGSGNDILFGNEGFDTLRGGKGNDTLSGGADPDELDGGLRNDTYNLSEGGGDTFIDAGGTDKITSIISRSIQGLEFIENLSLLGTGNINGIGNSKNNVGGANNDILTGNAGNDRFVFNTALSSTTNRDTVIDFGELVRKQRYLLSGQRHFHEARRWPKPRIELCILQGRPSNRQQRLRLLQQSIRRSVLRHQWERRGRCNPDRYAKQPRLADGR